MPSPVQFTMWEWWLAFWDWVDTVVHDEPFCVVFNGDAIDGVHHKATSQISHNLEDQCAIALKILEPIVEKCNGQFYFVRGTAAHVGEQGVHEERLAKSLGAIPNDAGQYSRYDLWKQLDGGGLVHFSHHIGTAGSTHYESSALAREIGNAFIEAGRWGDVPPDVVVRSHRHRNCEVRMPNRNGYAIVFTTAAWQLKTPFVFKIPGGSQVTPQIGGSLIRHGDEELHTRHWVRGVSRSRTE